MPSPPLPVQLLRRLQLPRSAHPRGQTHLSSASGLVFANQRFFVVADDEHQLGMFGADPAAPVQLLRLMPGELPREPRQRKALKPDFEVLMQLPQASPPDPPQSTILLALGSGSRPNRQQGIHLHVDDDGGVVAVRYIDLQPLYAPLHPPAGALNIEGGFFSGEHFLLLQRGDALGTSSRGGNAAFIFDAAATLAWLDGRAAAPQALRTLEFDLGAVDGVALCFTDAAALGNGRWLFSAVAEASENSYDDGPCVASALGLVDAQGALLWLRTLAGAPKVEGVAARLAGGQVQVVMVTDADNPAIASTLLSATLPLAGR